MAGSFPPQNTTDFWDQYQQAPPTGQPVTDPTFVQASGAPWGNQPGSQNTGINGGNMGGQVQPVQTAPTTQAPTAGFNPNNIRNIGIAESGENYIKYLKSQGAPDSYIQQQFPGYQPSQTPTTAPATGGGGKDAFGQAWLASGGRTVDDLKAFVAAHPEYGVKLGGSKGDKVYGPDGAFWADAVISSGIGGGQGGAWNTDTGGGGAAGGGSNPYGFGGFGSFVTPIDQFKEPTTQDYLNDPGLQFALSEANRMSQNSAAAKGTLLNGRFQQALGASNVGNALQGVGDIFNRKLQTFGTNFGVQTRNQDAPFSKYYDLATLGQRAAGAS